MLSKEKIKILIEDAFEGVTLDGGISLEQTKVMDNYGEVDDEREYAKLRSAEVISNWKEIPKSNLDEADCLPFLDQKGFRYYIAALMLRLLEDYDPYSDIGTLRLLYPKTDDHKYLYEILSKQQNEAIATFMKILPDLVELTKEDKTVVKRAFDRYWSNYLSE